MTFSSVTNNNATKRETRYGDRANCVGDALQPQQADLHAFASQLWALPGQFKRAI